MHIEAYLLMGKILLKMGSLNLEPQHGDKASGLQEESKIADEQDWQHQIDQKSYQQSFYA